jgi:hypothetical protein
MALDLEFERKKAAALVVLGSSKIWQSNYLPPMTRIAWRLGWQVKPPHFINPWFSCAGFTAYFFVCMYAFLSLFPMIIGSAATAWPSLLMSCLLGSLFFGASMGLYYFFSARQNQLPRWVDL